jgi:Tfp pilus assembly protein PilO
MNFNKLPKEKQTQLIAVILFTLAGISGLWFTLLKPQYDKLDKLGQSKIAAQAKLQQAKDTIKNAPRLESDLAEASKMLAEAESDVASGDLYLWTINVVRKYKAGYSVDIPQFGQLGAVQDTTLLPSFQYKQTTMTIAGTGHFSDVGRFVADFENRFPHIRIQNLSLELNAVPSSDDPETLAFKMDLVMLVKPGAS